MENLFEYRTKLETLHYTQEQKVQLIAQIKNVSEKPSHAARRPLRRIMLITAAIAVVFVVGGGALAIRLAGESFAPVFGTAHTEIVNKIGRPIDAGTTDDGITITADAIIGDKYNACIIYTIKRADSTRLGLPAGLPTGNLIFEQSGCDLHGGDSSSGSAWFTNGDTGDNTVHFFEIISGENALKLGRVNAKFHELRYLDPSTHKMVTLSDGTWQFAFQVSYEDSSIPLPTGETFTQDGMNFTVTNISVSSVALRVEYTVNSEVSLGNMASEDGKEPAQVSQEMARYLDNVKIILTKKDGSILDLTSSGGGIHSVDGKTICEKSGVFKEIIPTEDMKLLSIGGIDIPINAAE